MRAESQVRAGSTRFPSRERLDRPAALFDELCRVFCSKPPAMQCAIAHGQVTIDGYVIRDMHLNRWSVGQLRGRYARLVGRTNKLEFPSRARSAYSSPISRRA